MQSRETEWLYLIGEPVHEAICHPCPETRLPEEMRCGALPTRQSVKDEVYVLSSPFLIHTNNQKYDFSRPQEK